MEGTEERMGRQEVSIEITLSEQQKENRLKKMNRDSWTFGIITKDLTLMSLES